MAPNFLMSFFNKLINLSPIWSNTFTEWMLNGKFQSFMATDQSSSKGEEKAMEEIGKKISTGTNIFLIQPRRIQMWRTYDKNEIVLYILLVKVIVEMKTCYYELLGVDKKATSSEIKKVHSPPNSRVIELCPWNITLIKIPLSKPKQFSFNWPKPTMFFQIPMKGLGTITTEKKYSLTNRKCPSKMLKCIHLGLIFGTILLLLASRDLMTVKALFIMFTGMYFKKLKHKKPNPLPWEMTLKNKWGNFKVLGIPQQFWKECLYFMMIGKTLQHTKHSCGQKIGIQEKPQTDTWKGRWRKKTKKRDKNKKRRT